MVKNIKTILIVIFLVSLTTFYFENSRIDYEKKYNTELVEIKENQYRKQVADSLTNYELKEIIRKLEVENIKKPKIVIVPKIEFIEVEKVVEKVQIINGVVKVEDYYPNKENPFIKYTLYDTISNFKFYPIEIPIVLHENKDKTWSVDIKTPDFIKITDIKANSLPVKSEKKRPFYLGAGMSVIAEKQSYEIIGGIKIGRVLTLGSINKEKDIGIKTLYNF